MPEGAKIMTKQNGRRSKKNMKKTAILFGATGLVGSHLLKQLLEDPLYSKVISISRRNTGILNTKLENITGDLANREFLNTHIRGDVIYCCLGTTIKKAGSKEAFTFVDLHLPVLIAEIGEKNNIPVIALVSSLGASTGSSNFYLRTKGQMEKQVFGFNYNKIVILRPSMLLGKRTEFRFGEALMKPVLQFVSLFMFGAWAKYKAIKASTVARALMIFANEGDGKKIVESDDIEKK